MLTVLNVSVIAILFMRKLILFFCVDEPIVICTECRFSDPASTTMLDTATVEKKRELTVDQFRPYFVKGMVILLFFLHLGAKYNLQGGNWTGSLSRKRTCSWSSAHLEVCTPRQS